MAILSRLLIIYVGLVAAPAFAGKYFCGQSISLAVRYDIPALSMDERATLNALLFHEGREVKWDERLDRVTADVLNRGLLLRPPTDDQFDELAESAPAALIDVLRRGRGNYFVTDSLGPETALTSGQMLAIERMTLESLIGMSGVKMKWDRRLEAVAHYVVSNGRRHEKLLTRDFDYLTRALRNGKSDPVMIDALLRVLRGPNL